MKRRRKEQEAPKQEAPKQEAPKPASSIGFLKEALALRAAYKNCTGQRCGSCPLDAHGTCAKGRERMEECIADFASTILIDREIFEGKFSRAKEEGEIDEPAVKAFETVMALNDGDIRLAILGCDEPVQKESDQHGTCASCLKSRMHPSGIRWCISFGNFVHEDGFCYRYISDKIESQEPVDN